MCMYMEARGQPWVLFFVVIHLVLCVCFYELVSHWLIWGMPIMTAWLAREPKRSSCLTSPVLGLQVTSHLTQLLLQWSWTPNSGPRDHPASTLLTELSDPSTQLQYYPAQIHVLCASLLPPPPHSLHELCLISHPWIQKHPFFSGHDPQVNWNFPLLCDWLSKCTLYGTLVISGSFLPKLVNTYCDWKAMGLAWSSDVSPWASNLSLCLNFNAMHF